MAHVEHQDDEGGMAPSEDQPDEPSQESTAAAASLQARQRRKIAQLEEKLEVLEAGRATKERYNHYFMYEVGFTDHRSGSRTTIWLKEGQLGALLACSTMSRTSSLKMTEDTT
jgi:hypothetical protein